MSTQQPAAFPRFPRAESNPKIIVFPSVAPAKSAADFPRPLGAPPVTVLETELLLEGDTLSGHVGNARQLLSLVRECPELLDELLPAIARRLELVGRMLSRELQVLK
jgi:hypothetical protein